MATNASEPGLFQSQRATGNTLRHVLNKVPEVTLYFWAIKILATTVGETAADFLNVRMHLGLVVTSYVMSAVFLVALFVQMRTTRYVRPIYWTVVVFISVVGTLVTDNIVDKFGVSLQTTTILFSCILALIFAIWWRIEHTLSVHEITTTRREGFYWAAILFTFALGTSAGDLLGETLRLGYALSAVVFAIAIAAVGLAYFRFKINGVLAFWIAYILTRPLGASLGDLLSQPLANGGLALGTTLTSAVFLATIVALIVYLNYRQRQQPSLATA